MALRGHLAELLPAAGSSHATDATPVVRSAAWAPGLDKGATFHVLTGAIGKGRPVHRQTICLVTINARMNVMAVSIGTRIRYH